VPIIRPQGVKGKLFYTTYQSFAYAIAVPAGRTGIGHPAM
jgi:hypothetical protein